MWIDISSPSNDLFRSLKNLGVKSDQLCLASGRKLVPELIAQSPARIRNLIVQKTDPAPQAWEDWSRQIRTSRNTSFSPLRLSTALFKELDSEGTDFPLVVMETPELKPWDDKLEKPMALLALSSPVNVGAAVRSCVAFGINHVVLLKESASPFHPKAIRSSAGSVFSVEFTKGPSIQELNANDKRLVAFDLNPKATPLPKLQWPKNPILLVGEEGRGLGREFAQTVYIPTSSKVESLNATIALSIALFNFSQSQK